MKNNLDPIMVKAYQLINEPIDPNLPVSREIADIVDYTTAVAGEDVYVYASPSTDRAQTVISITSSGELVYQKIDLKTPALLTFTGMQSKMETVLIDEILNSKDQTALAQKKDSIIRQMNSKEAKNIIDLCLGAGASQEVYQGTGEDLLDVIIKMKQLVSDYATDYVLLVASDVMDLIESYDKAQVSVLNYSFPIKEQIKALGITKIIKILGNDNVTPVLASGKMILVGRNSDLIKSKPLVMVRKVFQKEVAELSGAGEGAVRLIDLVKLPVSNGADMMLGYSVIGYEQISQALVNYRAIAFCNEILI